MVITCGEKAWPAELFIHSPEGQTKRSKVNTFQSKIDKHRYFVANVIYHQNTNQKEKERVEISFNFSWFLILFILKV